MLSHSPRRSLFISLILMPVLCLLCAAQAPSSSALPRQFAGWQLIGNARQSSDPAVADSINASLLKEYGFSGLESATYHRDDGRKLAIKIARFADATGAYGAFTYYLIPQMNLETIGDGAASLNERVLFHRGNLLVDAVFDRLTAMSAAELRELSGQLPLPASNLANLPGLPNYLPKENLAVNSAKFIVGPVGAQKTGAPLSPSLIDFSTGAEMVMATYRTASGESTLTLISYPTPQIAAERLKRIAATESAENAAPKLEARRSGPLAIVATGPSSAGDKRSLLQSVNYEADVTWNEKTNFTKRDNLANLLVNIIVLCGILIGFSAIAGIAFGGARVVLRKFLPHRVFDRPENEFISLQLSENGQRKPETDVSSSIKSA
jgi:hypothetical protein